MFRRKLKPLNLVVMIGLCLPMSSVLAQDAVTKRLIVQGYQWHQQGREELASEVWQKVLSIDPNQPDALMGMGLFDIAKGRQADARKYLDKLQAMHPQSSQFLRLRMAVANGPNSESNLIKTARRAAQSGHYDEALHNYEMVFQGKTPSPDLALEYYQCLAGAPGGWERASQGLQQLAADNRDNSAIGLVSAQVMTYQEPARREGIHALKELTSDRQVGSQARKSWRQALLWLNASTADIPLFQDFLNNNPNDAQIRDRIDKVEHPVLSPADAAGIALGQGFKALNSGDTSAAEKRFSEIIRNNPQDANALGGLGSIRLRQQRFDEAVDLLQKAAKSSSKWRSSLNAATYWKRMQAASDALKSGNSAQAMSLVQQNISLNPREPAGYVALGDLQSKTNPKQAEANYQKARDLDPNNAGSLQGLAMLYGQQGRVQEAEDLYNRLPQATTVEQRQQRAALHASIARAQAQQAAERGDMKGAQSLLEAAMNENPDNPWIRLDLARLYHQTGHANQGQSTIKDLLAHNQNPESLHAAALYAQECGDWDQVRANLQQIPNESKTSEMVTLDQVAWLQLQARQAHRLKQQGQSQQANDLIAKSEEQLGQAAAEPSIVAALAEAYADSGNDRRAMALGQKLINDNPQDIDVRLQYASILLRAHHSDALKAQLAQLQGQQLNATQKQRFQELEIGQVIDRVDTLREAGSLHEAQQTLDPLIARNPNLAEVQAAQARIDTAEGNHRRALAIYQGLAKKNSDDVPTLVAIANSASAMSQPHVAKPYIRHALELEPKSPEVLAAAGRVARASGKNREAEEYFRQSLAMQQEQSKQTDFPTAVGHTDASKGVMQELRQIQVQSSNAISLSLNQLTRSGDKGLGRLSNSQATLRGEFSPGAGNLEVRVTPTVLDRQSISYQYRTLSRFGGGPSAALNTLVLGNPRLTTGVNSTSFNKLLISDGDSTQTRDALNRYALSSGLYNRVRPNFTTDEDAQQAIYQRPLYAYFLNNNASVTSISDTAKSILNDRSAVADLSAGDISALQSLAANPEAAKSTPSQLISSMTALNGNRAAARRIDHRESGTGFSVAYKFKGFDADIGMTPSGFPEKNVIGGLAYKGQAGQVFSYTIAGYRRPVMDSSLSFAGATDPRLGLTWGGVTSNGGRLSGNVDGQNVGGYLMVGANQLRGTNVQDNSQRLANAGIYFYALRSDLQSIIVGFNTMWMKYDKNLSGYTLGHGGYFSPQRFTDMSIPFHWTGHTNSEQFTWKLDASAGVQRFRTHDTPYFPTNPAMQRAAYNAAAVASLLGLQTGYTAPILRGERKTTFSYRLTGTAEWEFSPRFFFGSRLSINNGRDYRESSIDLYLRFVLDRHGAALGTEPDVKGTPYFTN